MDNIYVDDDPGIYSSNFSFVSYVKFFVTHPAYRGMADAVAESGEIQWKALFNRHGGRYPFNHAKLYEC